MYGNELDLSSPGDKHLLNQGWRSLKCYFNEVEATDKQKCILQVTAPLILAAGTDSPPLVCCCASIPKSKRSFTGRCRVQMIAQGQSGGRPAETRSAVPSKELIDGVLVDTARGGEPRVLSAALTMIRIRQSKRPPTPIRFHFWRWPSHAAGLELRQKAGAPQDP